MLQTIAYIPILVIILLSYFFRGKAQRPSFKLIKPQTAELQGAERTAYKHQGTSKQRKNKRAQLGLQCHHPTEWTERRSGNAVKLTTGLMP
jgi:hypothetical protein